MIPGFVMIDDIWKKRLIGSILVDPWIVVLGVAGMDDVIFG